MHPGFETQQLIVASRAMAVELRLLEDFHDSTFLERLYKTTWYNTDIYGALMILTRVTARAL